MESTVVATSTNTPVTGDRRLWTLLAPLNYMSRTGINCHVSERLETVQDASSAWVLIATVNSKL